MLEGEINSGELSMSSPSPTATSDLTQHADSKITTTTLSLDNIDSINLASYQMRFPPLRLEV